MLNGLFCLVRPYPGRRVSLSAYEVGCLDFFVRGLRQLSPEVAFTLSLMSIYLVWPMKPRYIE